MNSNPSIVLLNFLVFVAYSVGGRKMLVEKRQIRRERHLNCKYDDKRGMEEVRKYKKI